MTIKGLDAWLTRNPFDSEGPCEMCGYYADDCVCPECPGCTQQGDPACYREVDLGVCGALHGKETLDQRIGRAKRVIEDIRGQLADAGEALYFLMLEKHPQEGIDDIFQHEP